MLGNIIPEVREFEYKGEKIAVTGLTLEQIGSVLQGFRPEVEALFGGKLKLEQALVKFPVMSATLIAVAAGEPGAVENARKLPFSLQLDILMAVWDMTVLGDLEGFMGNLSALGKGLGLLSGKAQGAQDELPPMPPVVTAKRVVSGSKT